MNQKNYNTLIEVYDNLIEVNAILERKIARMTPIYMAAMAIDYRLITDENLSNCVRREVWNVE